MFGVLGCGLMGFGIVEVLARAGLQVGGLAIDPTQDTTLLLVPAPSENPNKPNASDPGETPKQDLVGDATGPSAWAPERVPQSEGVAACPAWATGLALDDVQKAASSLAVAGAARARWASPSRSRRMASSVAIRSDRSAACCSIRCVT